MLDAETAHPDRVLGEDDRIALAIGHGEVPLEITGRDRASLGVVRTGPELAELDGLAGVLLLEMRDEPDRLVIGHLGSDALKPGGHAIEQRAPEGLGVAGLADINL